MGHKGEINTNSMGERFVVKEYRRYDDVDVVFEIDNSLVNTTYARVKNGHVKRGNKGGYSWIGEPAEDINGESCVVVEYFSDDNATVQYSDGDIVTGLKVDDIMSGAFSREPEFNLKPAEEKDIEVKIKSEIRATFEFAMYLAEKYRRCVIIRPCGFGKSWLALKIFHSKKYEKCLFLHPMDDDENSHIIESSRIGRKVDSRTYAWLYRLSDEQIKKLNYDVVFCDEVHCVGGNDEGKGAFATYNAVKKLMETHPQTHFIGATATPRRMDGINVISTLFHDHICYPYTEEEAFESGVLKTPNYYYCIYNIEKKMHDEMRKLQTVYEGVDRDMAQLILRFSDDEIAELDAKYMWKHLRKVCNEVLPDTDYMQFIAFYLSNEEIEKNKDKVIGWFKKAFPEHEIGSITVTDRSRKSLKDVDNMPKIPSDEKYKGRINIIFNCKKLCMGYHSENTTGLIIDRKTQSLLLYMQMIGRLLSCHNQNSVIIFDIVDNIHSDFIYNLNENPVKTPAPVSPVFFKEPVTFDDICKAYPRAIHWDEIKKVNKKVRLGERIRQNNAKINDKSLSSSEDETPDIEGVYGPMDKPVTDIDRQVVDMVNRVADEKSIGFNAAVDMVVGMTNDNIVPISEFTEESIKATEDTIMAAKTVSKADIPSDAPTKDDMSLPPKIERPYMDMAGFKRVHVKPADDTSFGENPSNKETQHTEDKKPDDNESKQEHDESKRDDDRFGFDKRYYYNKDTKELISNYANILNKKADFKNEWLNLKKEFDKTALDAVIKKWHTYPDCEENYTSYEEYFNDRRKRDMKYKLLRSCSEFYYGISIDKVVLYMIEGKINVS